MLRKECDAGFVEVIGIYAVRGRYSPELLRLWKEFDQLKG